MQIKYYMKILKEIFRLTLISIAAFVVYVIWIIYGIIDWGIEFFKRKDYE